jgi:hypothetical protein
MIIKGIKTDYLVIPLDELYNEIDVLETEILVHNYDINSELRNIAEVRIKQIKELIEHYN